MQCVQRGFAVLPGTLLEYLDFQKQQTYTHHQRTVGLGLEKIEQGVRGAEFNTHFLGQLHGHGNFLLPWLLQALCLSAKPAGCPVHAACVGQYCGGTGKVCGTGDTVDAFSTGQHTTRQRNLPSNTVKSRF